MSELVKIDDYGKIFLPKRIRDKLTAREFLVDIEEDDLILRSVRDPLDFFGTLRGIDASEVERMRREDEKDGHTS